MATQLPETVLDLIRVIGEADTLSLMRAFPKVNYDVPYDASKSVALKQAISFAGAERLCANYGGERLYVPDAANLLRIHRNEAIREAQGIVSINDLAKEYGLSYRRIQQIQASDDDGIKLNEVDEKQGVLF